MAVATALRPGLLAILLPVSYALLLPSASLHPLELLRQVRVRLSAALFHVKLLGVTDGGGLLTWPRVQLQVHVRGLASRGSPGSIASSTSSRGSGGKNELLYKP